jgi:tetratricopeptide (TPR) repeat protein
VTFLVGISVFAWSERERRPYVLAGWLWFLGALVPVIGMVQVGSQARADRYAYIPMIGLLIAAVWLMADIMRELKRYKVGIALLVSTTVALGLCSRKQIDYWRSNYDLWLHAFQVTADNYLAADKVGVALQDEGRPEEAYPYFEQVLRINSADPLANFNVGVKSHLQGDIRGAIRFYQVTANQETDPMLRAEAFENMGTAYRQLGDLPAARESYLKALQYDPRRSRIYTVLREMGASPAL